MSLRINVQGEGAEGSGDAGQESGKGWEETHRGWFCLGRERETFFLLKVLRHNRDLAVKQFDDDEVAGCSESGEEQLDLELRAGLYNFLPSILTVLSNHL